MSHLYHHVELHLAQFGSSVATNKTYKPDTGRISNPTLGVSLLFGV
jgi:hypothetical protein